MCTLGFDAWFANHLGESQEEVSRLLEDKTAVRFLIAWSLLESKCFDSYAKIDKLPCYCQRLVNEEGFDLDSLSPIIEHFHSRYQDESRLSNLLNERKKRNTQPQHNEFKLLLKKPFDELCKYEKVFLIVLVVYRYRNNIFHGAKGVASWLQFEDQIKYCVQIMQFLITHATKEEKSA